MYDVAIIGGGPAAIFAAYEFVMKYPKLKLVMLEAGNAIDKRFCPLAAKKVDHCINCKPCSIMRGFGGAGAFSDGKYNFTTEFGGWLNEYLPEEKVIELIDYVDELNCRHGAPGEYFTTKNSDIGRKALRYDLHLLNAKVRHLGTENNLVIMENIYKFLQEKMAIRCNTLVESIVKEEDGSFSLQLAGGEAVQCKYLIAAPGRAGAEWYTEECRKLGLSFINNQVDIGVRVEVPADVFKHITDEVYEAKILYRTQTYNDMVRTFCMNPKGAVVNENTNGIVTVNGHSYEDPAKQTNNTNFALLVAKHFSEPFKDSNGYGESIARLSNMLGGGVMVQRFGDLMRGQRSTHSRIEEGFVTPTLSATPGDLSLVMPKRILDGIVEMIYALDKIAPGTANDDTLLYGVEVKFYNMEVATDENLETLHRGLFVIGDCGGVTHSLSQASASGVHVARYVAEKYFS